MAKLPTAPVPTCPVKVILTPKLKVKEPFTTPVAGISPANSTVFSVIVVTLLTAPVPTTVVKAWLQSPERKVS